MFLGETASKAEEIFLKFIKSYFNNYKVINENG
jgi:hypothetical protein